MSNVPCGLPRRPGRRRGAPVTAALVAATAAVDVPQPAPDTIPVPPGHERPPNQPPEIIEPPLPGEHAPIGDPSGPGDAPPPPPVWQRHAPPACGAALRC